MTPGIWEIKFMAVYDFDRNGISCNGVILRTNKGLK
jgi:hypothetical protein